LASEAKFKTDTETIAASNSKIDLKLVAEARDLIAERRANGRRRRGYDLASPHSRSLAAE